jgi:hypothetical protein
MALVVSCLPATSLRSQSRPLPAIDYANEVYYYDTAANNVLKLETGLFKNDGPQSGLTTVTNNVFLDGKKSAIRMSNTKPSFLLKLRSKDIDPLNYLGFCTLKSYRKARIFAFAKTSKFKTGYTFNNDEIKSWTIKKVADGIVMLTPNNPLPPGEYSFYFFVGIMPREPFAFGVD